ncbi:MULTISPECIES: hypothetical protein [Nocardiaceae]|uniref:Uncharacterized protein n=1 Tax=Rhodococcoides corynebacterioides TaxID=53972 RepID=A0ABS2KN87_9NOCA|nr:MULTISPECIES: hypothetical protein [Rhodococcus]MBM7413444.1 hypothetical protein [Rhodococcus corynebacterioides]MBP1115907.1 hypothetical protein [Rhodococcus sp. PvP016]
MTRKSGVHLSASVALPGTATMPTASTTWGRITRRTGGPAGGYDLDDLRHGPATNGPTVDRIRAWSTSSTLPRTA